jgi:hypothetical protein
MRHWLQLQPNSMCLGRWVIHASTAQNMPYIGESKVPKKEPLCKENPIILYFFKNKRTATH